MAALLDEDAAPLGLKENVAGAGADVGDEGELLFGVTGCGDCGANVVNDPPANESAPDEPPAARLLNPEKPLKLAEELVPAPPVAALEDAKLCTVKPEDDEEDGAVGCGCCWKDIRTHHWLGLRKLLGWQALRQAGRPRRSGRWQCHSPVGWGPPAAKGCLFREYPHVPMMET